MKELLNPRRLGLAIYLLQIDHLSNLWMNKDVMATADTRQAKAERFHQSRHFIESNILRSG